MTLTAAWAERWHDDPSRVVLVDAADGRGLTAAQLDAATAGAAAALHRLGVGARDRVLLSCGPGVATVVAYVGILRLGAVVVPANTAYTSAELEHIVGDVRPAAAVVDDVTRVPPGPVAVTAESLLGEGGEVVGLLDRSGSDDLAMIAFTSGTTGRPKGAMLDHGNLLAGAQALVTAWEWTADDRLLHALPMFHMHGLGAGINGSLTAGASMVVLPRFAPDAVVDAVAAYAPTMFFGVPTMYALMREAGRLPGLAGLRLLVSGSAPLDPALFADVAAQAGQPPVERYGMSETVMLVSNPVRGERRAGSVGLPLPGVQVRLGEAGGVEVMGRTVFRGYWERPDATAEAFTEDGWFRTGDIGELDDDGYLRLVGRASDLIITAGYNVYPREVEDVVRDHPAVLDVAVVGLPDATWGETVAAFVVLRPDGADVAREELEQGLAALVEGRLAAYKRPRRWVVVDELPRNAMGKVRRDVLRDSVHDRGEGG
ncbi:MAG: AMP-binding protein [Candidatus Nanopelagicales bacterium]